MPRDAPVMNRVLPCNDDMAAPDALKDRHATPLAERRATADDVSMQAYPRVLVVMALPLESDGQFERLDAPLLFTGVGKVNAAHALTRRLTEYRLAGAPPPHVLNF